MLRISTPITLGLLLSSAGIQYLYLGKELGGRPNDWRFHDDDGYVLYNKLAESPMFKEGISRLIQGASDYRIAVMCSEAKPDSCHRHLLIAPGSGRERSGCFAHIG